MSLRFRRTPAAICAALRAYWFGTANFWAGGDRPKSRGVYTPILKAKNTDGTKLLTSQKFYPKNESRLKNFTLKTSLQPIVIIAYACIIRVGLPLAAGFLASPLVAPFGYATRSSLTSFCVSPTSAKPSFCARSSKPSVCTRSISARSSSSSAIASNSPGVPSHRNLRVAQLVTRFP